MTPVLSAPLTDTRAEIRIFDPLGTPIERQDCPQKTFPVTDLCERNATLMGEDYVKLAFSLNDRIQFEAFSFIVYDDQFFFLKERYRPTPKGNSYEYNLKFSSVANMLSKHTLLRYYTIPDAESLTGYRDVEPEPDFDINADIRDMAQIVVRAIQGAANRVYKPNNQKTVYAQILEDCTYSTTDIKQNTPLKTFSFEGSDIASALTQIADDFDTEWWLSVDERILTLHLSKCEDTSVNPFKLSDYISRTNDSLKPYASNGLTDCEYANEWSNIPQYLLPLGSDRNMTRKQAMDELDDKDVYVSYGKRLRLTPNHTYNVKDKDDNDVSLQTNAFGAVTNPNVTTAIEQTENFDDIYPQGHFCIYDVSVDSSGIYTIKAHAVKLDAEGKPLKDENDEYETYTDEEATQGIEGDTSMVIFPITNKENTDDLTIIFESGFLNGREFAVARKGHMDSDGIWHLELQIQPDAGDDDSLTLPQGNFIPVTGDLFAIFGMDMPEGYTALARQALAQAAYNRLVEYQDSRPDIKCKTFPEYLQNNVGKIYIGQRHDIYSELFGNIIILNTQQGEQIDYNNSPSLTSRVIALSYPLPMPYTADFTLASGRVQGAIESLENTIADRTSDIRGLEQRNINLSTRGWHDADELRQMLQSLADAMMLVGVARYQFAFTFAIDLVHSENAGTDGYKHTLTLRIGYPSGGWLQHTQKPYIDYDNQGRWELPSYVPITLNPTYDPTKAYYLYAECYGDNPYLTASSFVLTETPYDGEEDTAYMLLGVLSSEYQDNNVMTSYRVFNRTNGYTQIAGGTITTEQIQDPTRSLIIDFASDPPRIIAVNGAEIIGNIKFKSFQDENGNNPLDYQIGGENLYTGGKSISFPIKQDTEGGSYFFDIIATGVTVSKDNHYVVSIQSMDSYAGYGRILVLVRIWDNAEQEYQNLQVGELSYSKGMTYITFRLSDIENGVDFDGGEIVLQAVIEEIGEQIHSFDYWTIYGLQIQIGQKPTTYQTHVKYLAEAFENEARQGSTEIEGGLLMTCLLKLLNQQGQVTAGMSGLRGDNVLQWGGANYAQAVYAAAHNYLTEEGGNGLIPYLIKKDGTGKIGCFRIVDDNTIAVVTGENTVYITTNPIAQYLTSFSTIKQQLAGHIFLNIENTEIHYEYFETLNLGMMNAEKYSFYLPSFQIRIYANYPQLTPDRLTVYEIAYVIRAGLLYDYEDVYECVILNEEITPSNGTTETRTTAAQSFIFENTEYQPLSLSIRVRCKGFDTSEGNSNSIYILKYPDAATQEDAVIKEICRHTVIGRDGMVVSVDSDTLFAIHNDGKELDIKAIGLPETQPTGSGKKGQLWNDNGTLKVATGTT